MKGYQRLEVALGDHSDIECHVNIGFGGGLGGGEMTPVFHSGVGGLESTGALVLPTVRLVPFAPNQP